MLRANAVMADGPPMVFSNRLAAVLSLTCSATVHSSSSDMSPPPTRGAVLGEFATIDAGSTNTY
jgi:hypothetical protein